VERLSGDVVGSACRWDLILAGDICYEAPMTGHVMPWLQAMAASGAEVWIADPGRAYLPQAGLTLMTRYLVPTTRELENRTERSTGLFRLYV
jgi:predicted nicotinamide N-methyase